MDITGTPGEIYERHMVPAIFARWAPDLVTALNPQPGERILDLACGTGAVTRLVADRVGPGGHVVGLDINPGMLAAGRVAVGRPEVEWVEGSVSGMPLPDASFDGVICQQGFQFFPDRPAALREIHRVLKPGGRLVLAVWRSIDNTPGFRILESALGKHVGPDRAALPPFSLGDGAAIRALIEAEGFRDVTVRADAKLARFTSGEHMVRSIVGGAPTMAKTLAELGSSVIDQIIAECVDATRHYVDDDGWATPIATNVITAVRP